MRQRNSTIDDAVPVGTPWHAASRQGPRTVNADATAVYHDPVTGRSAFVVADGVGDSEAAAAAARLAADIVARTAPKYGARAALLAAHEAVPVGAGDCVLVVAVPGAHSCEIAWVGDCRAYYSNGRVLQQITVDHTVAEFYRSRAWEVTPAMEHLVTTSVRTLKPELIGTSRTSIAVGRLLLCTDGVHRTLSPVDIRSVLDLPSGPDTAARLLVDRALYHGGRDNSTAMVVDHALPETPAAAA
jgi:PPM family protein phosphatase